MIDIHDAAFPGTLPVLDKEAVRLSLLTSLALNCTIVSPVVIASIAGDHPLNKLAEPSIYV